MKLHSTRGVCPECLEYIDASYSIEDDAAYYIKTCPEHGKSRSLIYRNPREFSRYIRMFKQYQKRIGKVFEKPGQLCIYPTSKCNLGCPICSTKSGDDRYEMSVEQLDPHLKKFKNASVNFFGGEPTVYKHLGPVVKRINKYGSTPVIFSNGIRIANLKYARWLKKIGVKEVNLQYEGSSEANVRIRGADVHEKKLKAIRNLNKVGIDVYLEVILEKGVNTHLIDRIFNLGLEYRNIKSINFRPYFTLGANERHSMPVDDMIRYSGLDMKNVEAFNRFILALPKLHSPVICLKHRFYLLVNKGGKYEDMMKYYRINKVRTDRLAAMYNRNQMLANIVFYASVLPRIMTFKGGFLLMIHGFRKVLKQFGIDTKEDFMLIDFNGRCDNHVFDEQDLCGAAVVDFDGSYYESFNVANIGREELFRNEA
jgi:MoaA/NifB/PqqE/SkfB family radical SAM enzyme